MDYLDELDNLIETTAGDFTPVDEGVYNVALVYAGFMRNRDKALVMNKNGKATFVFTFKVTDEGPAQNRWVKQRVQWADNTRFLIDNTFAIFDQDITGLKSARAVEATGTALVDRSALCAVRVKHETYNGKTKDVAEPMTLEEAVIAETELSENMSIASETQPTF